MSIANTIMLYATRTGGVILTGGNQNTRRKTCPNASVTEDKHRVTNSDGEDI